MIEIILREDVSNYETKPLFGFSYRQAAAIASAALIAVGCWYFLTPFVPADVVGILICVLGAACAAGFLVKIQGMYGTKRLPILIKYYTRPKTTFTQNYVFRTHEQERVLTKREAREEKHALKQTKHESEFCSVDGSCVNAKKRLKLVACGEVASNKRKLTFEEVESAFRAKVEAEKAERAIKAQDAKKDKEGEHGKTDKQIQRSK